MLAASSAVATTHHGKGTSSLVPSGSSVMTALAAEGSCGDTRAPQGLKPRSICDMFGTHSTPSFHSVAQGRLWSRAPPAHARGE